MKLCACVCVFVCVCVCCARDERVSNVCETQMCTSGKLELSERVRLHSRRGSCERVRMYMLTTPMHMYMHMYAHVRTYVCVWMFVCMHACASVYA